MGTEKEEKFEFQSEVKQLLDILVYSLYKNKEVFLRELVSNAADALNKMQFEFLTVPDLEGKDQELKITVSVDKKLAKLVIEDNGVGMSREELVQNIGTIAHSGTLDYFKKVGADAAKKQVDLIGKFGVGFYSSFMVADRVQLVTRRPGDSDAGCRWESTGDGTYTVEDCSKESRGTEIILHLKDDMKEYLDEWKIRSIVKKYSDYVQ